MYISKSKYCLGVQCPKILWLKKNKPEGFNSDVMDEARLKAGNEVGDLAMGIFGDFVEIPFDGNNLEGMIAKTSELISAGEKVICEASFSFEGAFCSVDILINLGNKEVELYEVKSSSFNPRYIHKYYPDVAYQNYVLTKCGYNVKKVSLIQLDSSYVRHGELDLSRLFHIEDLTTIAKSMFSEVEENLAFLDEYLSRVDEPSCQIGCQCNDPYECGFFEYCTKDLVKPNVFGLVGMSFTKRIDYYNKGIINFSDLIADGSLAKNHLLQAEHEANEMEPYIEKEGIKEFLDTLSYPLYFLDFETVQDYVPQYDNSWPFEQIPFQYSLHYIEYDGGPLMHKEYLARPEDGDPRRALAEQLCADIPMNVCTTAYYMPFEKGRIKELAELYPDLNEHLMNIHDNIKDLYSPFKDKLYYCRAMEGSASIKYVLPALYPNEPSLDYHNLEQIHHGQEAMAAFRAMLEMTPEEVERCRKNLLAYCGLDTLAMVKVWEKLNNSI